MGKICIATYLMKICAIQFQIMTDSKKYYILGCDTMCKSFWTFHRSALPPSSGPNSEPSKHTTCCLLLRNPENGCRTFFQNVGEIILDF
jgi:hypothetical protein